MTNELLEQALNTSQVCAPFTYLVYNVPPPSYKHTHAHTHYSPAPLSSLIQAHSCTHTHYSPASLSPLIQAHSCTHTHYSPAPLSPLIQACTLMHTHTHYSPAPLSGVHCLLPLSSWHLMCSLRMKTALIHHQKKILVWVDRWLLCQNVGGTYNHISFLLQSRWLVVVAEQEMLLVLLGAIMMRTCFNRRSSVFIFAIMIRALTGPRTIRSSVFSHFCNNILQN